MESFNVNWLNNFKEYLISEEKSTYTIEKYMRDVTAFYEYAGENEITKDLVL